MRLETAQAILECCKEGGYYDEEIPTDEDTLIKEAVFYFEHATAAAETEEADETIRKIAELGKEDGGYVAPEKEDKPAGASIEGEHLPIPAQIEGDPPTMPMDLSEVKDKAIRRLAGEFNACLSRTIWLLSEALTDELHLKSLRDDLYQKAFIKAGSDAAEAGEKVTKDDKDALARQTEDFLKINSRVTEAENTVRQYKSLKEIYGNNIDRLSREATLRDDEHRRGGK